MTSPSSQPIQSSDPLHSAVLISQKVTSLTSASQECPVFGSFCGLSEMGRRVPLLCDGSLQNPQLLDKENTILLELSQILTSSPTLIQPPHKNQAPHQQIKILLEAPQSSLGLALLACERLLSPTLKFHKLHFSASGYVY